MKTLFPIAMVAAILSASVFIYSIPSGGRATAAEPELMPSGSDLPPPPQPGSDSGGPAMPSDAGAAMPADTGAAPDNSEVLTRGPVHEAFATPLEVNPQPGPVIKKEPPPAIEEMPPDQKPDGDNVVWIPGYYSWDDDRQDFIWVSGVWRNVPPDQTWVAGYWNKVPEGFQWTPGFWTSAKKAEVNYLPAPPQSLEVGPNAPAPSDNNFWVPGTWVYRDRYVWQPGFWTVMRPDWIWVPAHFVWTPGGYVFVGGYWDYTPQYRGCLFAPVVFSPGYYRRPVIYTPAVVINLGFFSANLFCRPSRACYYFGDYYGVNYVDLGFRPWFSLTIGRGGYDPLCNYYRWRNTRNDPNWLAQSQRRFDMLQKNPNDRPPRTFAAQEKLIAAGGADKKPGFFAATTIQQAAKDPKDVGFKMHEVSLAGRQDAFKQAQGLNKISQDRLTVEKGSGNTTGAGAGVFGQPNRNGGNNGSLTNQKLKLSTVTSMPANDSNGAGAGNLGRNKSLDSNGSQNNIGNQAGNTGDANKGMAGNRFNKQFGTTGNSNQTDAGNQTGAGNQAGQTKRFSGQGGTNPLDGNALGGNPSNGNPLTGGTSGSNKLGQGDKDTSPLNQFKTPGNTLGPGSQGMGNQFPGSQGSGNQGLSGTTNKPNFGQQQGGQQGMGGQGGGGTPRMAPNNSQQQKKDNNNNNDDPNKKGNRSDNGSPRTNFSMDRSSSTGGIDVGGVVDQQKAQTKRDLAGGKQPMTQNILTDKPDADSGSTSTGRTSSAGNSNAGRNYSANGYSPAAPGATGNAGGTTTSNGSGTGYSRYAGTADNANPSNSKPGTGSSGPTASSLSSGSGAPAPSNSTYQMLMQRGRSLSQPSASGSSVGINSPDGNAVDPRLTKDPIGSYGYGSTPTQNPLSSGPTSYSFQSPSGPSTQGLDSRPSGQGLGLSGTLDTMQHYTPQSMPKLQRGLGNNSYAAPINSADPSSRTYDPNQQPSNSYDPNRR